MKTKLLRNIIILILVISVILFAYFFFLTPSQEKKECATMNSFMNLRVDSCFDKPTKTLIINLNKTTNIYDLDPVKISYLDQIIFTVMPSEGVKYLNLNLTDNPKKINVTAHFTSKDADFCSEEKQFSIDLCTPEIKAELLQGKLSNTSAIYSPNSDKLPIQLVNPASVFTPNCVPNWQCSAWETCDNGIQRRECIDQNSCVLSSDYPDFTRSCSETCKEDWKCSWSSCVNGITTPTCTDSNSCGTVFSKPSTLQCIIKANCIPNILCSSWSSCNPDYTFASLDSVTQITGTKTRICSDSNSCTPSRYESQACSIHVDVYTKKVFLCGKNYVEVYDKLTNQLLARVQENKNSQSPSVDISFTDTNSTDCNLL